jgi:circadian clock protein KaiB
MSEELSLQLFVAGRMTETLAMKARISELLDGLLEIPYKLRVTDVLEEPQAAEMSHILVTPTLVVRINDTERRLVGDLSDLSRLQLVIASSQNG